MGKAIKKQNPEEFIQYNGENDQLIKEFVGYDAVICLHPQVGYYFLKDVINGVYMITDEQFEHCYDIVDEYTETITVYSYEGIFAGGSRYFRTFVCECGREKFKQNEEEYECKCGQKFTHT